MNILKSHWYYWYTGRKQVALISMALTAVLVGMGMFITIGFSLWGIIIAVLLDTIGLGLVIIYALVLRDYLPTVLLADADTLVINQFVIPVIAVAVVGRLVTFIVAGTYRYIKKDRKS